MAIQKIQNKKPKPKASSKTDAMKALTTSPDAEVSDIETAEPAPSVTPAIVRPRIPAPIVRPAPAPPRPVVYSSPKPASLDRANEEDEKDAEESAPESAGQRPRVAFDPILWQWRDEGGFIHIKTGEVREETEFLDPNAKPGARGGGDEADWDAPQDGGGDDW